MKQLELWTTEELEACLKEDEECSIDENDATATSAP
jgi:hypothetical protein